MIALRKRTIGAAARMIPINLYTQMFSQSEEGANTNDRTQLRLCYSHGIGQPRRMAGYRIGRDRSAASLPTIYPALQLGCPLPEDYKTLSQARAKVLVPHSTTPGRVAAEARGRESRDSPARGT